MNDPPARVRVTGPARRRTRTVRRDAAAEIDADSVLGEFYLRALVRTQFRLGLLVLLVLGMTVGSLPLVFHFFPALTGERLLGVPVAFVVLGVLVYPFLLALAWVYVRFAERNERAFSDLVERQGAGEPADQASPSPSRRTA